MTVLLVGASGFVGSQVFRDLVMSGHTVKSLSRTLPKQVTSDAIIANVTEPDSLKGKLSGIDAVIFLPGLLREVPSKGQTFQKVHFEAVRTLAEAVQEQNPGKRIRWIQMSALGADKAIPTKYMRTKWIAEEFIRSTNMDWTIIRPSIVFPTAPTPHMNFVSELQKVIRMAPFIPVFGDGKYMMQPISLTELSNDMVLALAKPEAIGRTIEFGGPETLEYDEIMRRIAKSIRSKKSILHLPLGLVRPIVRLLESLPFFPVTDDQIVMLLTGNVITDPAKEAESIELFGAPKSRFLA